MRKVVHRSLGAEAGTRRDSNTQLLIGTEMLGATVLDEYHE
jgi:hypothetical protein